jgi:hypothetical protein
MEEEIGPPISEENITEFESFDYQSLEQLVLDWGSSSASDFSGFTYIPSETTNPLATTKTEDGNWLKLTEQNLCDEALIDEKYYEALKQLGFNFTEGIEGEYLQDMKQIHINEGKCFRIAKSD